MFRIIGDVIAWIALALAVAWFVRGLQLVNASQSVERGLVPSALIAWAAVAWLIASRLA